MSKIFLVFGLLLSIFMLFVQFTSLHGAKSFVVIFWVLILLVCGYKLFSSSSQK